MIKAVLFDASGVLHVANMAVGEDLQQEFNLSDAQVKEIFKVYMSRLQTAELSEKEFWQELRSRWGIREVNEDEHLLARTFIATLKKMPGMYEFIDELKAKGLKVALLSNVAPPFAEVLERKGHYLPFDVRVLSHEIALLKPNPAIYHLALQRLNVKPEETIFIDDQEKNVIAAEQLGVQGIVFRNTEQVKDRITQLMA